MSTQIERQREADAAHFEDWSEWASFGGRRPYGCELLGRKFWLDVPPIATACRIVERLPGALPIPRALSPGSFYIPAEHWRALRAALPEIRDAIDNWHAGKAVPR